MLPSFRMEKNMMTVVLPVCRMDLTLMLKNLDWQEELDGRKNCACVLSLDGELSAEEIHRLEIAAWRTFSEVETCVYPTAPRPCWPDAPNWAFQHTARHMVRSCRAWFWMEPDCVPLQPGWFDVWNDEYFKWRKPIMGTIVEGMGHCNGTAVYPPNFPKLCPEAMTCTDTAWDGLMKSKTIRYTHNAYYLLCHVWGIENGQARPFGGDAAHFSSWEDVERWVDLRAVLFHRSKDGSLIDQFRAKLNSQLTSEDIHVLCSCSPD
jgi:hypothetical protein